MNQINQQSYYKCSLSPTDSDYYMNRIDKNSILNNICFGLSKGTFSIFFVGSLACSIYFDFFEKVIHYKAFFKSAKQILFATISHGCFPMYISPWNCNESSNNM